MAMRSFTDSAGDEWQAFDVVPLDNERRHYDRRSDGTLAADSAAGDDSERRDPDLDRRLTVGGQSFVSPNMIQGWLCFEHGGERRRLSPIPDDWRQCTDRELEAYCQSARPVRRVLTGGDRPAPR